jgi:hypothetical protein
MLRPHNKPMANWTEKLDMPREFRTTQWTMVLKAGPENWEGREALENLCRAYWYPLYSFLRRKGNSPDESQDLVQGFFEQLLKKEYLESVQREKGKFRTFLLTSLTHFATNEWDKARRLKRGGGQEFVSIDARDAEERFQSFFGVVACLALSGGGQTRPDCCDELAEIRANKNYTPEHQVLMVADHLFGELRQDGLRSK